MSVNITDTLRIRMSNKHDRCIMETDAMQRYTPGQQRDINLVRLYVQALTLSDLSTPDGYSIREPFLLGHRLPGQRIRMHWPRQSMPSNSQRRLWRKFIQSTYLRYGLKWRNPLGPTPPHQRPQTPGKPCINEPTTHNPGHTSSSLHEYISRLPRWHKRLLTSWRQEATDLQIWRAFRSRQSITIASDGGLKHRLGTHGWKIVARQGRTLFSGSGPVDGPCDISHSTRSELGGLTAPLLLVSSLARFWGIHHRCRYNWITDSKAAISRVTIITTSKYSLRRYPDDVDYVTAIQELHRSLGGRKLRPFWVKGHQDENQDYEQLSAAAKLNIDVDQLASDYYWSGHGTRPSPKLMHLQEHKVTIAVNGEIYPTRIDEQIRYHINGSYLKEQLKRKHGWSECTWGTIDITAFGRHFKSLAGAKQVQHMKFVHDLQPIGVNMAKIQGNPDNTAVRQCPCCHEQDETQLHLLQCRRNPARAKAIQSLKSAIKKSEGTNKFYPIIGDFIDQWLSDPAQPPSLTPRKNPYLRNPYLRHENYPIDYLTLIHSALTEQHAIGWLNMLKGFLSSKWHQLASVTSTMRKKGHQRSSTETTVPIEYIE